MMLKKILIIATALFTVVTFAATTKNPTTTTTGLSKDYSLIHLQRIVTNSSKCRSIFNSLKKLTNKHISLIFTPTDQPNHFTMTESNGAIKNSIFYILKQHVKSTSINRVGMGSFTLNNQKIDYVVQVGVDLHKHTIDHYLYPVILSSNSRLCYYTALLKPTKETAMRFAKKIQTGKLHHGSDLTQQSN